MKQNAISIFTVFASEGYYLAFDSFNQAAYSVESFVNSDEIQIYCFDNADTAMRVLQAKNVYSQILHTDIKNQTLSYLPPLTILPYGALPYNLPSDNSNHSFLCYTVICSDYRYFIVYNLKEVKSLLLSIGAIDWIKIQRFTDFDLARRKILSTDAALQVLNGKELNLLPSPIENVTYGFQGYKPEEPEYAPNIKALVEDFR